MIEPGRKERIQKVLSRAGLTSRRQAERWMSEGRITVNGKVVTEPGTRVDLRRDAVRVNGRRIRGPAKPVYYLLNKPAGYVTTTRDPQGRPTVLDLLHGVRRRVFPVGRLDYDTAGLLVLTNDGDLAERLLRPASGCPKTYRVKVKGSPSDDTLRRLSRGIVIEGRRTLPCRIRRCSAGSNSWLEVVLTGGRQNQIRRMFLRAGHPVQKLRRVAIGPVRDRSLPTGRFRPLTEAEVSRLREALG